MTFDPLSMLVPKNGEIDAAARRVQDVLRAQMEVLGVNPIPGTQRDPASVGLAIRRTKGLVGVDLWSHYRNEISSSRRKHSVRVANRASASR